MHTALHNSEFWRGFWAWQNISTVILEESENILSSSPACICMQWSFPCSCRFLQSDAVKSFVGFILAANEAVAGKANSDLRVENSSQAVQSLLEILDTLSVWVDEIPPVQRSLRYGNPAFKWVSEKLKNTLPIIPYRHSLTSHKYSFASNAHDNSQQALRTPFEQTQCHRAAGNKNTQWDHLCQADTKNRSSHQSSSWSPASGPVLRVQVWLTHGTCHLSLLKISQWHTCHSCTEMVRAAI